MILSKIFIAILFKEILSTYTIENSPTVLLNYSNISYNLPRMIKNSQISDSTKTALVIMRMLYSIKRGRSLRLSSNVPMIRRNILTNEEFNFVLYYFLNVGICERARFYGLGGPSNVFNWHQNFLCLKYFRLSRALLYPTLNEFEKNINRGVIVLMKKKYSNPIYKEHQKDTEIISNPSEIEVENENTREYKIEYVVVVEIVQFRNYENYEYCKCTLINFKGEAETIKLTYDTEEGSLKINEDRFKNGYYLIE